jgi:hypothetical protein
MNSKKRGAKHTFAEKQLMRQVADVFSQKKQNPGAKTAAKQLGVSLPSFYNYANGTDLPRIEVLRDAQEKWGITWMLLDPSEILRSRKFTSANQLSLPLDSIREQDVEVVEVHPKKSNVLRITLNIRFSA